MPFLRQTVVVLAGLWGLLGSFTAAQEFDTVAFMVFEPNGSPYARVFILFNAALTANPAFIGERVE